MTLEGATDRELYEATKAELMADIDREIVWLIQNGIW